MTSKQSMNLTTHLLEIAVLHGPLLLAISILGKVLQIKITFFVQIYEFFRTFYTSWICIDSFPANGKSLAITWQAIKIESPDSKIRQYGWIMKWIPVDQARPLKKSSGKFNMYLDFEEYFAPVGQREVRSVFIVLLGFVRISERSR